MMSNNLLKVKITCINYMTLVETAKRVRVAYEQGMLCAHTNDEEFVSFKTKYPRFYDMLITKGCNETMLYKLLEIHEKMIKGQLNQRDADEMFGEIAAKEYVYPKINH